MRPALVILVVTVMRRPTFRTLWIGALIILSTTIVTCFWVWLTPSSSSLIVTFVCVMRSRPLVARSFTVCANGASRCLGSGVRVSGTCGARLVTFLITMV